MRRAGHRFGQLAAGAALVVLSGVAARAAEPAHPALAGLAKCAGQADVTARATCYDAASAALDKAVRAGDVVIVQKAEAQAAQKSAFGLNLPALNIFDRAGPGSGAESRKLESIVSEVKSARRDEAGRWIVELTDGAVWRQTDDIPLAPPPRPGSKVELRTGALGSFFMKIDQHRGVRAKRSQ